ncbi:MFS transporter [Rhodococcus opacus]|uniref:Putative proline/betaine transporter n=1 Tax=Rhodococcus opacus TaxID=37919 RepID=A0AAX3YUE0_RHOOP|nr:MFS transporter [Rhodococcus opacus]MCZ4585965.1 MFS transporter [Rhodococcus opacus]WLF52079.1 MFS transporter [Rhodococcus opacus]
MTSEALDTAQSSPQQRRQSPRRVATAALVGNAVEYYDFTLYGLLAVVFAPLFFPSDNEATSLLAALVVIGAGYVSRPIGGLIFGHLGDRIGRRPVLMISLLLMGLTSTVMGLLPTYETIGLAAPVLLAVLRMLQGISAGGETAGSQVFIVESAPPGRRGPFGSLPAMGIGLGGATAFFLAAIVALSISPEDLSAWGWRIPFLLCLPLTLICVWLRTSISDSPAFKDVEARDEIVKSPVAEVVRGHFGALLRVALLTLAALAPLHLAQTYMVTHLVLTKGLPVPTVYLLMGTVVLLSLPLYPVAGWLGDKYGRVTVLAVGWSLTLVLAVPAFLLIGALDTTFAIGIVIFILLVAVGPTISGVVYTAFTEMFPANVRFSGMAMGFNFGTIFAAGLGPYLAAQLVQSTGWAVAAAFWGTACAGLGLLALLGLRGHLERGAARG